MPKRRRDFESLGPATPAQRVPRRVDYALASGHMVANSEDEKGDPVVMLWLRLDQDDKRLNIGGPMYREDAEALIRDLVAACNDAWPTP